MTPIDRPQITVALGNRRLTVDAAEFASRMASAMEHAIVGLLFESERRFGERKGTIGDGERLREILNEANEYCHHPLAFREEGGPGEEGSPHVDNPLHVADYLANRLDDEKSLAFYKLVASLPREVIRDALMRALDVPARDIRRSRAAIFASLVRPHLRLRRDHSP